MNDHLTSIFLIPFTRNFGLFTILIGLYSIFVNVAEARRQNHKRDEAVARIGGWCLVMFGFGVLLYVKIT